MLITSLNNERVKELVKLHDKKYRDMTNTFFVEGIDLINEAYKNKCLDHVYILDGYNNLFSDIECTYVSYDVMKKISKLDSITEYFGVCKKKSNNVTPGDKIIILDGIQDPGNLGTIIRSAVAFNFDTVVLSPDCVDLYNPKVIRSTKGMIFNVNVITSDLSSYIKSLQGYKIYGTDVINGYNIKNEDIDKNIVIVIGNEGNGISDEVRKLCDKFIYIDMNNNCESLNAGVSASIIMYEVNNK